MRMVSHLRRPLRSLFSASSHIAILHALQDSREGMSGRGVARQAGINHQVCAVALRNLERMGALDRRGSGKTQLIRLNFRNYLVKEMILPLFRKERELFAAVRQDLSNTFKDLAL